MNKAGLGTSGSATAWYVIPGDSYLVRWFNTLHWPYTMWNLSYVAIGAALADEVRWDVLGWTCLAFFLGMGVAAHALDLLKGDPLALKLPRGQLKVAAALGLIWAVTIGLLNIVWGNVPPVTILAVLVGSTIVVFYNLEVPGFHGDLQFALFWGVFPVVVGFLAMGGGEGLWPPLVVAIWAGTTAMAQRTLSTIARFLRRQVIEAQVHLEIAPGSWERQKKAWLLTPLDRSLMYTSFAMPALAGGLLICRL